MMLIFAQFRNYFYICRKIRKMKDFYYSGWTVLFLCAMMWISGFCFGRHTTKKKK